MADVSVPREAILLKGGAGRGSRRVLPSSLVEVAGLIGCEVSDLVPLRYGAAGVMWMSRSRQLDRDLAVNRNAAIVVSKLHHIPVYPRGAVVCFPHGLTFEVDAEARGASAP